MGIVIVVGAGFIVLGMLMMGAGAATLLRARREAASRRPVWGVVDELRPGAGLRGSIYCPVVRFQTETGEVVTFQSEMGGQPPLHTVGERVAVFYDPARPAGAELQAPPVLWMVPAGFIAAGLVFAAVGAVLMIGFGLLAASG